MTWAIIVNRSEMMPRDGSTPMNSGRTWLMPVATSRLPRVGWLSVGVDCYQTNHLLLAIRDGRLYREEWATFEEYCKEKWGMTRRHANRLVESAQVIDNLGPIGPKPATESQARPLSKLPPSEQPDAWKQATDPPTRARVEIVHLWDIFHN